MVRYISYFNYTSNIIYNVTSAILLTEETYILNGNYNYNSFSVNYV